MLQSIDDIKSFQRSLKPSNSEYIICYLNMIYQHLLMREETPNSDINDYNNRKVFPSNQKQKIEKGISFKVFCQFFDIQEFISERIFKYLDKSKKGKLTRNEFINGLNTIFFGSLDELYKFTFYLCDFNENNKIHKLNMNLILSYIPKETYEEQNDYIKHIKTINNHYFINLDKEYPEKNIGIDKEIDFELYQNSIENYIDDEEYNNNKDNNFNNNGAFLLFINLISYIYENHPFNPENINYCQYLKNKALVKNARYKLQALEKINNNNKFTTTTIDKSNTVNPFSEIGKIIDRNRQKSHFKDKEKETLILPKIDLYRTSKRSFSLHNTKIQNKNIKKESKKAINKFIEEENQIKNIKTTVQSSNNKKNIADYLFKNNNLIKSAQFNDNTIHKLGGSFKNKIKIKNDAGIPQISPIKHKTVKFFVNSESSNKNDDENDLILEEEENNINQNDVNNNNDEYSDLLFKYCDEDNSKIIKKYFACIKGKDILFFSSNKKNDLVSIWNINKAIIKIEEKTDISKYTFYPIKFTFYNRSYCLVYFEEKENQLKFAKKCEENTNFLNFDNLYEIKDKIGEGHFGVVKTCIEKLSGKEYAVKIMNKNKIKEKDFQLVIQERNYMSLIKHPNIVSLIQDFEDENYLYFVMEYFKGGDLSKYLLNSKQNEKNLEKISAKVIKIIAQGVQYLNNFGIVHRDLKPENIIFEKENDIKSIKIIDLGVAITLPYGQQASDPIGTLTYIAPEIFLHNPYSHKVDIWSIGILLYYLATGGILPFDDEKFDEKIIGKKIVFTHQEYPEENFGDKSKALICLIDKALEKTPEKRISINEFLKEEWLNKYSK